MDYGKVYHRFWKSRTVRGWDDQARTLALYLLTSQHSTSEGYYHLPAAYVAVDLGWSLEDVDKAFARLDADGFARYDEAAEVVLVVKALQWNEPKGPKQIKGAINRVQEVPASHLLYEFATPREGYQTDLQTALIPLRKGIEGVSEQVGYPFDSSSSISSSISSSREPLGVAAAPTLELDAGLPTKPEDGKTYSRTLAEWLQTRGRDMPDGSRAEKAGWLLDSLAAEARDGVGVKTARGCASKVIADYLADVTDADVPQAFWGFLGRLVASSGVRPIFDAVVVAVESGAGLTGQHAEDPLSLLKYATAVKNGRAA